LSYKLSTTPLILACALAASSGAQAKPQNPLPHCHMEKVCVWVPASHQYCPGGNPRPKMSCQQATPAHQSCIMKKVCND